MDDGVIKFKLNWEKGSAPIFPEMPELLHWRDKMFELGLIGYDDKYQVGFGNISFRPEAKRNFVISGTQTGHLAKLEIDHFTEVTDYDIAENWLNCRGSVKASSESLTHAAIYESDSDIRAVIHIHHDLQWEKWLDEVPTTRRDVPYGTPGMAQEIQRLFRERPSEQFNLIAMAGHQGGLISFGKSLEQAAQPFLDVFS